MRDHDNQSGYTDILPPVRPEPPRPQQERQRGHHPPAGPLVAGWDGFCRAVARHKAVTAAAVVAAAGLSWGLSYAAGTAYRGAPPAAAATDAPATADEDLPGEPTERARVRAPRPVATSAPPTRTPHKASPTPSKTKTKESKPTKSVTPSKSPSPSPTTTPPTSPEPSEPSEAELP